MSIESKVALVRREPTEEVITEPELVELFERTRHPKHYIGYEVSGLIHLGHLYGTGVKLRDFIKAGIDCTFFMADWHSFVNNKLGGDWERIKLAARYYQEVFSRFVGPDLKFLLGSDLYHCNDEYWIKLIRVEKAVTLNRVKRCLTIMGRKESERLDFSQFVYPPLQVTDIFAQDLDIAHAGIDQRKAHMLAREVAQKLKWKVPVAVHHHLLGGLSQPVSLGYDEDKRLDVAISSKMSKSKPWTCIFIHDSAEAIKQKLKRAWCPPKEAKLNPVLELVRYVIFEERDSFRLERNSKYGGDIEFQSYPQLERAYVSGEIHPEDLKLNVAAEIDRILTPMRKYFEAKPELLEPFKEGKVTR
ncbi:MAG: tyrosine--tRNA ligase [Candidatus Bathyarchaeia archaeon]